MSPRNSDWHRRRVLCVLLAAPTAALAGCQGLVPGQGPPPDLYRLTAATRFPKELPTVYWQLLVEPPVAPGGLNSTRIALLHSPMQLEYYAHSDWADRVPQLVQALIVQSFENSNHIKAVGRDALDLRADYVLKAELRDFQAEYFHGGAPVAHVGLNAKLVALPRRVIVASAHFDQTAEARADRVEDVVSAFNVALGRVLEALVAWTLQSGEADRTAT